jgi:predicted hydrocarbon binding protein
MGDSDLAFRLLPMENKLRSGVEIFADIFNHFSDQRVRVENHHDHFIWKIERCPICWNRVSEEPVCHMAIGLLQESLYWVSGGKNFKIEETACIAKGDESCDLRIDKQALD